METERKEVEVEEAELFLKEVEDRLEVIDIDVDDSPMIKKRRFVSMSPDGTIVSQLATTTPLLLLLSLVPLQQ